MALAVRPDWFWKASGRVPEGFRKGSGRAAEVLEGFRKLPFV